MWRVAPADRKGTLWIRRHPLWHPKRPKLTQGVRSAYMYYYWYLGDQIHKRRGTNQFVRGTFFTHRVIMSWTSGTGQCPPYIRKHDNDVQERPQVGRTEPCGWEPPEFKCRVRVQKSCLPCLVDSQERDIPGCETVATSGPNAASDASAVLGNPGDRFGGCELLVEDVVEFGNPTLVTHEVTHGIWFAVSTVQRTE